MEEGKYIYCIISEDKKKNFGYIGINNRQVDLLHYKDIAAVTSPNPITNFNRLDKKELTQRASIHQQVNEKLMAEYDVVPMRFGIIAPRAVEVISILEKAYLQFKTALDRIAGKAEFAVQVWWDQKNFLEELTKTNPEIQKLKQGISSKGSILGLPTRLRLGKLIDQEIKAHKDNYLNDIEALLKNSAYGAASNKLIEEEMIANFSFLIDRARESELDREMQELGKKYKGKLRFKYIGPMPPYSFVNINLSLGNFELVNEARKLLGLNEEAAFNEIKKGYRQLAIQYHPDRNIDNPGVEEEFKKIAQAYSVLENYCRGCDEFMGKIEGRKYSFREEDVKNSVMVK